MARLARVVAVDVPHHVTQRANARQFILNSNGERMVYMDLLRQAVQLGGWPSLSNSTFPHNNVGWRVAQPFKFLFPSQQCRVPLDKSEGPVKDKKSLAMRKHRDFRQRR
jgi:hypothetical protein